MTDAPITIGSKVLGPVDAGGTRCSMLLWGAAGCGKTTLASTAPGNKLWILFDPDGCNSLSGRDDVLVYDLSGERDTVVEKFKNDDAGGIENVLKAHPEIETVVFDSVTSFGVLATDNAVRNVKSATNENPGLKGYGHRNAVVLRACIVLMRLTKRYNRNIIIIAHENSPTTDDNGHVMHISVALGERMTNQLGMQLSEIWWMQDTGKERRIAVRPLRQRVPMKSRMFDVGSGEFIWRYNAATWEGDGIATWIQQYKDNGGRKIPLPK